MMWVFCSIWYCYGMLRDASGFQCGASASAFKALIETITKSGKKAMFYKGANYWILPDGAIGRRAGKKGGGQN